MIDQHDEVDVNVLTLTELTQMINDLAVKYDEKKGTTGAKVIKEEYLRVVSHYNERVGYKAY